MSIQPLHAHFIAPKKKQKLLGVIIDATRPYKTETAPDFIIKIKIIDETLNCNTLNLNNPKKYIHIFLYSKTLDPYVTEIGDIIYLKIFDLELYSQTNEIKARKRGPFSKFYIFKGNPSDPADFSIKSTDDPEEYEVKEELSERIKLLRQWSRGFFRDNSLTKMNWWGNLKLNVGSPLAAQRDFDMILRLKSMKNTNKENMVMLELTDAKNQTFYMQFVGKTNEFKLGDVMKIRSVEKIEKDLHLSSSLYGSVMKLPGYSYDVRNFDREYAYELIMPEGSANIMEIEEEKKEEPQQEYNEETAVLSTTIKKGYEELEKMRKVTDIKEILEVVSVFKLGRLGLEELKARIFRIRCYIFDISPEDLEDALKIFCPKCKKMTPFKTNEIRHCCNSVSKAIWQIKLAVKDASIDEEPKHLELFICDFDGNGSEIFKGIRPNMVQGMNFDEMAKKYKFILQQIMDLSSIDYMSEFIIEPLIFGKEVIYRIVDTKFNQQ